MVLDDKKPKKHRGSLPLNIKPAYEALWIFSDGFMQDVAR